MVTLLRFADAEAVFVTAMSTVDGLTRVATRLPAAEALTAALPMLRVQRIGGADDRLTDTARLDLETFAATYDTASDLARRVHTTALALAHTTVAGVLIDTVETVSGPMWVDYENQDVQRFVATYEAAVRVLPPS